MSGTTTFSSLYINLRTALRDPQGGGAEGASPRWTLAEKKWAINKAIADAFPEVTVPYVDESTVTLAEDTFEYSLPSTLKRARDLREIWIEPTASTDPWVRQLDGWRAIETGSAPKLYIDSVWDSGQKLRLVYDGAPGSLSSDGDATTVPSDFIEARARVYLHDIAIGSASKPDVEVHTVQRTFWMQTSLEILSRIADTTPRPSDAAIPTHWMKVP